MTIKDKINLNDRHSIREISIKCMLNALGKHQAIRMIEDISNRNKTTKDLAEASIREIERLYNDNY